MVQYGTEEQKREFLPDMTRGEVVVWQTLTEPQSGSDVAHCLTTAIRDGEDYVINGQKIMVGSTAPTRLHVVPDLYGTLPEAATRTSAGSTSPATDLVSPSITYRC